MMMEIVSITKEKGNFYIVKFDNQEKMLVSEDTLVRYRLLKGTQITKQQFAKLKAGAAFDRGLQLAYHYISFQLRSEKEVQQYLKEKEIGSADSQKVIEQLKKLKLLDDENYAQSLVRTQIRISDKGPQQLKQQLLKKGIAANDTEKALTLYTPELQLENALKAAEKLLKRTRNKSFQQIVQKMKQTLLQKGFSTDISQLVMEELALKKDSDSEWESLQNEGRKLIRRHERLTLIKRKQKIKQSLYQKGFDFDLINQFIEEELQQDEY